MSLRAFQTPLAAVSLVGAHVFGSSALLAEPATEQKPIKTKPGAASEVDNPKEVTVELHGIFDHRVMLYSSNINFTTSNTQRSLSTNTATGGRGDLYAVPGINGDRTTGWALEGSQPNLARLDGVKDMFAEIRYRPLLEVATKDKSIRGIVELEIGGVRFGAAHNGSTGSRVGNGGSFSTDTINLETKHAYTQLNYGQGHSFEIGLIPLKTNRHLWQESTAGAQASGPMWQDGRYHLAWARGLEDSRKPDSFPEDPLPTGFRDMDAFFGRLDQHFGEQRVGVFAMYQRGAQDRDLVVRPTEVFAEGYSLWQFPSIDFDLTSVGLDAQLEFGPAFMNVDFIYQMGSFRDFKFFAADNYKTREGFARVAPNTEASDSCEGAAWTCVSEIEQTGLAGRLEAGLVLGDTTIQYTGFYISGDGNTDDDQWKAFLSTDVDFFDSAVFFEGVLTNDTVHTQNPYLFDKGFILNKLDIKHKLLDGQLTVGGAAVLNSLAAEIRWKGVSTDRDPLTLALLPIEEPFQSANLGVEVQLMAKYQANERLAFGALAASLIAPGDAWDFYELGLERNGKAEQDYTTVQANMAYTF